jgi:hypothetical protein
MSGEKAAMIVSPSGHTSVAVKPFTGPEEKALVLRELADIAVGLLFTAAGIDIKSGGGIPAIRDAAVGERLDNVIAHHAKRLGIPADVLDDVGVDLIEAISESGWTVLPYAGEESDS